MKKIVLSTIIATSLATSLMAEVKPYIGLGFNSFNITNSILPQTIHTTIYKI